MRITIYRLLLLTAVLAVPCAGILAQEGNEPPDVLRVTRVEIKPGQTGAYERIATASVRAMAAARWPRVTIAMRSVTGPEEVVFLTGYEDLGVWDQDLKRLQRLPLLKASIDATAQRDSRYVVGKTDFTLSYKKDISYKPDFPWSDMRCMDLITVQLKPGHGDEYLANRRIVVAAHTGADIHEHLVLYAVSSGIQNSTFVVLRPMDSLHTMDQLNTEHDGEQYGKVLGDVNRAKLHSLFAASVEKEEERYFCADPALSYVTPEWVKTNRDFWVGSPQ